MTNDDTLETDLADALQRRANSMTIHPPEPSKLRAPATRINSGRPPRVLLVAASIAATLGLAGVGIVVTGNDPDVVELADVEPAPSTTALTSSERTISTTTDMRPTPPPTVADLESLDDPGPLIDGPIVDFTRIQSPVFDGIETINWVGNVAGQFVVVGEGIDINDRDARQLLFLSDDGQTWRSVPAPPGQMVRSIIADGDRVVAWTVGFDGDEIGEDLWIVGDTFTLHPQQLSGLDLPDRTNTPRVWQGINVPLLFFANGDLYAAKGAIESIPLEQLAVDSGQIEPEERTCDIIGEGLAITISVSATSETDLDCQVAADVRDVVVTPESLGVSEADFLLHSGPGGAQRTFIYALAGARNQLVAEIPGFPNNLRVDGKRAAISLSGGSDDSSLQHRIATATLEDPLAAWTIRETPAAAILGDGIHADAWVVTESDPASLYRIGGQLGDSRLGTLPPGLSAYPGYLPDDARTSAVAHIWANRASDPDDGQLLGISTADNTWTWIDINQQFGPTQTAAATQGTDQLLLITQQPYAPIGVWITDLS